MLSSLFIVASTLSALTNGAENAYAPLVRLPKALKGAITALYNDYLYVFGGQNDTDINTQMWRISLANKFTLNTAKTDITSTLDESQWEELAVTYPGYGTSKDGIFVCNGQCSAVIGQYLYIVNPFNVSNNAPIYSSNVIYRLDLSQTPPVFATQSSFDFGYAYRYPCVTAVGGKLYISMGLASPGVYATDMTVYDPATNTISTLTGNTDGIGRQDAGCAGNVGQTNVYLFGGKSTSPYATGGYPVVDYYSIADDAWTNPFNDVSNYDWDPDSGANTRQQLRCLRLPSQNKVECVGGLRINTLTNSIVYDLNTQTSEYVDLAEGVIRYGLENYEFDSGATYSASLMIIVGGYTGVNVATNMTQYAVRYATITPEPTTDPTTGPTAVTAGPTPSPSWAPTCTGCTHSPSVPPTPAPTPMPSEGGDGGSGKNRVSGSILSCLLVIVSMLAVVVI